MPAATEQTLCAPGATAPGANPTNAMRCYVLDFVKAGKDLELSEPIDRATWLMLIAYCCFYENGGIIEGAREWGERAWFGSVCVTKAEVERPSRLWEWVGNDLHVKHYNEEAEENWKAAARERKARKAARARWGQGTPQTAAGASDASAMLNDAQETSIAPSMYRDHALGKERIGEDRLGKESLEKESLEKERGGEETDVPPPPFPKTVEEALKLSPGYDPEFVRNEWRKAAMRGNLDYQGNAIVNWHLYIEDQREFLAKRSQSAAAPANANALQQELERIREKLKAMPRYDKNTFPDEYAAVQRQAKPLRDRKAEIERLLGGESDKPI